MRKLIGVMKTPTALAQPLETLELETPREIASVLRCTPQHVNALHRKKIIPARVVIGRMVRFNRREVIDALTAYSNREAATTETGNV